MDERPQPDHRIEPALDRRRGGGAPVRLTAARAWLAPRVPRWATRPRRPRRRATFLWLSCAQDRCQHAVAPPTMAATGLLNGVPAFCGHQVSVVLSVLLEPAGPRCTACERLRPPHLTERVYPHPLALAHELIDYAFWHPPHHPCPPPTTHHPAHDPAHD